ncbi:Hypothetical protein SFBmNL_01562 [Candidatus Arthromitus sp. SFB-mouse-NL]|nr:Hypothetical protein SFBmNL_01562 [Candidatus Arthromitus sp. SFB-mouse-NL]
MHIFLFIFFNLYIFVIIKGMLIIGGNYGRFNGKNSIIM